MSQRVVGLFDNRGDAQKAEQELITAGFPRASVGLESQPASSQGTAKGGESFWDKVRDFFGMEDTSVYQEAARRGGTLVVVDAPENRVAQAADILQRCNPVDVDQRVGEWRKSGWQSTTQAGAQTGAQAIPVVEEKLKVGKRREQRGGVRIYTHVTEKPVEEKVILREEHVNVERRPADRPAGPDAFRERTIEAAEFREEPVVSKEARVVEEVVVNKEARQRTEAVRDKVRRTDVDVQKLDDEFRNHYQTAYAKSGQPYEQYRPAYEYGRQLAGDQRYSNRDWAAVERDAQTSFEQRNPGKWGQYRDAVRCGYDRARKASPRP